MIILLLHLPSVNYETIIRILHMNIGFSQEFSIFAKRTYVDLLLTDKERQILIESSLTC